MLSDRITALLAQQPGLHLTYLRYRLPDVDKAALDACLKQLCYAGLVEKRRHARYWLTGKQYTPRPPVIVLRAPEPALATPPRYAPSTFIASPPKERLMARR
jgi:hypothetical protein